MLVKMLLPVVALVVVVSVSVGAGAQESASGGGGGASGEARTVCNPACAGTEVCTRSGVCVPRVAPAGGSTGNSGWGANPTAQQKRPQYGTSDYTAPTPNRAKMAKYRRRIAGGAVLVVFGSMGIIGAGVVGFASGYSGDELLLLVGMGVELVSLAMFIPGLVMISKNKKRLRREQQYGRSDGAGLHLAGVSPTIGRDSGGLALSFNF